MKILHLNNIFGGRFQSYANSERSPMKITRTGIYIACTTCPGKRFQDNSPREDNSPRQTKKAYCPIMCPPGPQSLGLFPTRTTPHQDIHLPIFGGKFQDHQMGKLQGLELSSWGVVQIPRKEHCKHASIGICYCRFQERKIKLGMVGMLLLQISGKKNKTWNGRNFVIVDFRKEIFILQGLEFCYCRFQEGQIYFARIGICCCRFQYENYMVLMLL